MTLTVQDLMTVERVVKEATTAYADSQTHYDAAWDIAAETFLKADSDSERYSVCLVVKPLAQHAAKQVLTGDEQRLVPKVESLKVFTPFLEKIGLVNGPLGMKYKAEPNSDVVDSFRNATISVKFRRDNGPSVSELKKIEEVIREIRERMERGE